MKKTEHVFISGIESKKCTACKEVKSLSNYCKKRSAPDGLNHTCRKCANAEALQYRLRDPEKTRQRNREQHKKHRKKRVDYGVKYNRERSKIDVGYRMSINLRSRMRLALKNNQKSGRTLDLLGCTIDQLKSHLETKFDKNMNWENYGSYWHIDHIKPCASFDLSDPAQQKVCFHYKNLRPLEALENVSQGRKIAHFFRGSP